jgi:hypothetical protein
MLNQCFGESARGADGAMADLSGLISRAQDVVVPLRLQTPPKPPSADPPPQFRLPTPPKQGLLLPPTYAQATSAPPIYKGLEAAVGQRASGNNTPKAGGTTILPVDAAGTPLPTPQPQPRSSQRYVVDELCRPEGLRRNSKFILGICTFGIPLLLGLIVAIIYVSLRPKYPVVALDSVKVWRFSAVGGADAGGENPVLNLDLDLGLLASNPNKRLGMSYQEMEMLVSFENTTFPIASMPPFFQSKRNSSVISTRVMAANAALQVEDGALLQYDIARNDIPLRALIDVKACAQSGRWRTPSFRVHYVCDFRIAPPARNLPLLGKSCKRSKKGIPATYVTDHNLLD